VIVPLPLDALVVCTQVAAVDATHEQPAGAVIPKLPLSAAAVWLKLVGLSAYVQMIPAWLTVKFWPPAVIVALRAVMLLFASTV
jgi:hypothetical protein